jgi:ethanolamine ammonia-lyase small subunit
MAVAGNADPMLGYLTTSFREHPRLRRAVRKQPTSAMTERLTLLGALAPAGEPRTSSHSVAALYAAYAKAGGDTRTLQSLEGEGRRRVHALREQGFDLDIGNEGEADTRLHAIYTHARHALYATLDDSIVRDATHRPVRVRTMAANRDDYLASPSAGESLRDEDANQLRSLRSSRPAEIQVVISDGLNANAINQHLHAFLPALRRLLLESGQRVAESDIVVSNGRVRVGYEIGGLVGAALVIHLIGERPGTGLNTMSAYLTYGADGAGRSRWSRALDHAATTAICGIHPQGKRPEVAVAETMRAVAQILARKCSGVALLTATSRRSHSPS